jgi:hypothetical protein
MTPRGIRNNNPGNIRHGAKWQGLAEVQKDKDFCTFKSPEYGIRALARVLKTYKSRYGLNTVEGIINRYAPQNENDTSAYIKHIVKELDISPSDEIELTDDELIVLIKAIIKHENGTQPYSTDVIRDGILLE